MEALVAELRRLNVARAGETPSARGHSLGAGSFGEVFLSPTNPRRVLKVRRKMHSEDPVWCVIQEGVGLLRTFTSRTEASEWMIEFLRDAADDIIRRVSMGVVDLYAEPGPRGRVLTTGFLIEAIVGLELTRRLVEPGIATGFIGTYAAWRTALVGYYELERCYFDLHDLGKHMSGEDWQSTMVVVLANLAAAQKLCQFKHHDLHTPNVMFTTSRPLEHCRFDRAHWPKRLQAVMPEASAATAASATATAASATAAEVERVRVILAPDCVLEIALPMGTLEPKIIDMGMASMSTTDGHRVQRMDMQHFDDLARSGVYSAVLEGQEGYDCQYLINDIVFNFADDSGSSTKRWMTQLLEMVHSRGAISLPSGRPAAGRVSNVSPLEILQSHLFAHLRVSGSSSTARVVVDLTRAEV